MSGPRRRSRPGPLVRKVTDPRFWLWYHLFWSIIWLALYGPALTFWAENIRLLQFISIQTALTGSLVGVVAAVGARKADPEDPM